MKFLDGAEKETALHYIREAAEVARQATCRRSKCGTVIVSENTIIGTGFNSPPANDINHCRCTMIKDLYHKKVTDKTCCMHAEQRAIMDALTKHPTRLRTAWLYFARLKDDTLSFSGDPYCTICSKMALDVGISRFVLYHENCIIAYAAQDYNNLSYSYGRIKTQRPGGDGHGG